MTITNNNQREFRRQKKDKKTDEADKIFPTNRQSDGSSDDEAVDKSREDDRDLGIISEEEPDEAMQDDLLILKKRYVNLEQGQLPDKVTF